MSIICKSTWRASLSIATLLLLVVVENVAAGQHSNPSEAIIPPSFPEPGLTRDNLPGQTNGILPLETVLELVTLTDPQILEALSRYRSVKAERAVATSGFLPKIGMELSAGPEMTDGVDTNDVSEELTAATATVYARQNIYSGGHTTAFTNETDARILSAAWEALTVANRVFLDTTEAYINVLQAREMLEISQANVATQEKILAQVHEKTAAGFNRLSDLSNSEARLALARANFISRQQDLNQAVVKFHRQFGRLLRPEQFVLPEPAFHFPDSVDETVDLALRYHPALEVAKYNIQVRKFSYEKSKAAFLPSLDLELNAQHRADTNGEEGETDQASAMLKLSYTFFDGGARKGEKIKSHENLRKEYQHAYTERRNVNESARLAWNIMDAEKHKERYLSDYVNLSVKTLEAFKEEYYIGRRTLLDLLDMENEFDAAKNAKALSRYSNLIAHYRISQATGMLLHEYDTGLQEKVNLPTLKPMELTGYPELNRNRDDDTVADLADQCDNSIYGATTLASGCGEVRPITVGYQKPTELTPYIMPLAASQPEEATPEPPPALPPLSHIQPAAGTPLELDMKIDRNKEEQEFHLDIIHFEYDSAKLTPASLEKLSYITAQLKEAKGFDIEIIGHTDAWGTDAYNQPLSVARAKSVYQELIRLGIDKEDLSFSGRGASEPRVSNNTAAGRQQNRRIEFKLTKTVRAQEESSPPATTISSEADKTSNPEKESGTTEPPALRIDPSRDKQAFLLDGINFEYDSATLVPESQQQLAAVAAQLKTADDFVVEIIGHTDGWGIDAYNQPLSVNRAKSVRDELVMLGLNPANLSFTGRGASEPRASNDTATGRRLNRRIEFNLTRK